MRVTFHKPFSITELRRPVALRLTDSEKKTISGIVWLLIAPAFYVSMLLMGPLEKHMGAEGAAEWWITITVVLLILSNVAETARHLEEVDFVDVLLGEIVVGLLAYGLYLLLADLFNHTSAMMVITAISGWLLIGNMGFFKKKVPPTNETVT